MSTPFEQVKKWLAPGQAITLEPGSPIYKGPYHTHVIDLSEDGVRINVPLDEGKLVLLPVGTRVNVKPDSDEDANTVEMEIVMRTGGKDRSLLLSPATPKAPESTRPLPRNRSRIVPAIAVSSGKGGVGKTTFSINLAMALTRMGYKVCVIDADLGTANVDVLFNLSPAYNLAHVIHGEKHMLEVVVEGPEGLIVLPGGSGFQELTTLSDEEFTTLLEQFHQLEEYADFILIDTGSGLSPSVTNFLVASTEIVLVTTAEPHAITDCYALIKVLAGQGRRKDLKLVANRVTSDYEGQHVSQKMAFASKKFLGAELDILGHISEDPAIIRSVRNQKPVLLEDPKARSSVQIQVIAERLVGGTEPLAAKDSLGKTSGFFQRLRNILWRNSPSS